jgi:hypothetical protein
VCNLPILTAQGKLNLLLRVLGLDDLTGVNDSSLEIGLTYGALDPRKGVWPTATPTDWWFLLDPTMLDQNGQPVRKLPGTLSGRALSAGPGEMAFELPIGASNRLYAVRLIDVDVTSSFDPASSAPAPPPAAAQLRSDLRVVESLSGRLCGAATVESLASVPLPASFTSCGYTFCGSDQAVGPGCNSVLDYLVGGCQGTATPLQPDIDHGGVAPLTAGTNKKVPSEQSNGNRNAYSAHFAFNARRAHATGKR